MGRYGFPYIGSKCRNRDFVAALGVPVAEAPDGGIVERLAFIMRHIRSRLSRVHSIEWLSQVTVLHRDYHAYQYREGDVVYCDPPYDSREQYVIGDFDFGAFMDWAARIPCYVSSYEIDDPRFRIYHEFKKLSLLCATKTCAVIERLYASRYAAKEKI